MITPGSAGTMTARIQEDKTVLLENEFLRVVFDPDDAGAASSILHKPTDKELACCTSYGDKHFKVFREALQVQRIREAKPHTSGEPYELTDLQVSDRGATATFQGAVVPAELGSDPEKKPYRSVRLVKTYTLAAGASCIAVQLRFHNDTQENLPVAPWVLNGVRVEGEDVVIYAPTPRGIVARPEPWNKSGSKFLLVPQATEAWVGAVADNEARNSVAIVAENGRVEVQHHWLAKFTGSTFGFGAPLLSVPAGGVYSFDYSFLATCGLSRADSIGAGVAAMLSCEEGGTGGERNLTVRIAGSSAAEVAVRVALQHTDRRTTPAGSATLQVSPDTVAEERFVVPAPAQDGGGMAIVTLENKTTKASITMRCSLSDGVVQPPPAPELQGDRFWSMKWEQPLPEWMQACERNPGYPMIPWAASAESDAPEMLAIGRVGHSTGVIRDMARRAGIENWQLVNLKGVAAPIGFRAKGDNDDVYGLAEVKTACERLRQNPPPLTFTAGIQFENVADELVDLLCDRVRKGMGLVMVWEPGRLGPGPWPGIVAGAESETLRADLVGPLQSLFDAGIAPPSPGTIQCYRYGEGRIVMIEKDIAVSDWDAVRNDLLPQVRGRTSLPDWEYHFALYVRALRFAAGRDRDGVTITGIHIATTGVTVRCTNNRAGERKASLALDLLSTGQLHVARVCVPCSLQPGEQEIAVALPEQVAHELVVHAYLLDGELEEAYRSWTQGAPALYRDTQALPVLDCQACVTELPGSIRVTDLAVQHRGKEGPASVALALASDREATVTLTAEIRSGAFERVVWAHTQEVTLQGDGAAVPLELAVVDCPLAQPEGVLAVFVHEGSRLCALRAEHFVAGYIANVADDDVAYLTTTGTQGDWYATRVSADWAIDTAGFDPLYYRYGALNESLFHGGPAAFPWKREADNTLTPSIMDEAPLHEGLSHRLKNQFDSIGCSYFCMADEFRLGGEYDGSKETIAAFRANLRESFRRIEALNTAWQSDYASFDAVEPMLLAEARESPDTPAAWLAFRLFMDERVNRRIEVAAEEGARISPLIKVGDSGMYAPAYDVGVNFYRVGCASSFMMSYKGLRAAWTRAFLKPGAVAGTWLGYGWQKPVHPWETLFAGYRILAWWGLMPTDGLAHMAVLRPDLTPAHNYRAIGNEQREVLRGLGKLFVHARPATAQAFMPYSQASAYVANVLERKYSDGSNTVYTLLERRGIASSFIADEQAERGEIIDTLDRAVLFFPGIVAMPEAAAEAYARAIERGCTAVADADVALRNGCGTRLKTATAIDRVFGVSRASVTRVDLPEEESITWTADAPETLRKDDACMARGLRGLAVTDGTVWAHFEDGTPAVVAKTSPAGSMALLLNTRFEWSAARKGTRAVRPEDAPDELSANETAATLMHIALDHAGACPPVRVTPAALCPRMTTAFENGECRLYGLLPGAEKGRAEIRLPQKAHTYDSRAAKYLGLVDAFTDELDEAQLAKVYTQLPYKVTGMTVEVPSARVAPGARVRVSGQVVAEGAVSEFHVVHMQVTTPSGEQPGYYRKNLSAPQGAFSCEIPLPLNAEEGEWAIALTDAATGVAVADAVSVG